MVDALEEISEKGIYVYIRSGNKKWLMKDIRT